MLVISSTLRFDLQHKFVEEKLEDGFIINFQGANAHFLCSLYEDVIGVQMNLFNEELETLKRKLDKLVDLVSVLRFELEKC